MAKNQNIRIKPVPLQADRDALIALQGFSDYAPANPAYALALIAAKQAGMQTAQAAEVSAQNALDNARDVAAAAEWEFHNAMLGVKEQVIAQYGKDSGQVQSLGLKRKSEYKSPGPRKPKAAA